MLGMLLGLLIGILISFGVVWYLNRTPLPFVEKVTKPAPRETTGGDKPLALPSKPGDKPLEAGEKKFEFYEILEGKKALTPPPATASKPEEAPAAAMFLQIGAFQQRTDADHLKAQLAMLGFEAAITTVEIPDKGIMHRVRIGPFASADEMNRARNQLSQQGVPTSVVRSKD